jgi:hypothetical protein
LLIPLLQAGAFFSISVVYLLTETLRELLPIKVSRYKSQMRHRKMENRHGPPINHRYLKP